MISEEELTQWQSWPDASQVPALITEIRALRKIKDSYTAWMNSTHEIDMTRWRELQLALADYERGEVKE